MPVLLHFVDGPAEGKKPLQLNRRSLPKRHRVAFIKPNGFGGDPKTAIYELDTPYDGGQEGEYTHVRTIDAVKSSPNDHAQFRS